MTDVRDGEGMHCIWNQQIEFDLNDINKSFILFTSVFDKDNVSSDLVGSVGIDLLSERILLPHEEVRQIIFDIQYDNKSAGKIKIDFRFVPKQFNF
jgi:hypothetical protein